MLDINKKMYYNMFSIIQNNKKGKEGYIPTSQHPTSHQDAGSDNSDSLEKVIQQIQRAIEDLDHALGK